MKKVYTITSLFIIMFIMTMTMTSNARAATTQGYDGNANRSLCRVVSPYWGHTRSRALSLGRAMDLANITEAAGQLCNRVIYLDLPPSDTTIRMESRLDIQPSGAGSIGEFYTIKGGGFGPTQFAADGSLSEDDDLEKYVVLDAKGIFPNNWREGGSAIVIRLSAIRLKNIVLKNVIAANRYGIIVLGNDNVFDNFTIENTISDAYYFDANARNNLILPAADIDNLEVKEINGVKGYAIRIESLDSQHGNKLIPTNRVINADNPTSEDGLANFLPGAHYTNDQMITTPYQDLFKGLPEGTTTTGPEERNFQIVGTDANKFVKSNIPYVIQIHRMRSVSDGKIRIEGAVVAWPHGAPPSKNDTAKVDEFCSSNTINSEEVDRIQIHKAGDRNATFHSFIMPRTQDSRNRGLQTRGIGTSGSFKIIVDANLGSIVLIPEVGGSGALASSSTAIPVKAFNSREAAPFAMCPERYIGYNEDADDDGGLDGGGSGRLSGKKIFRDVGRCIDRRFGSSGPQDGNTPNEAELFDSDTDSILDDLEDLDFNCLYEKNGHEITVSGPMNSKVSVFVYETDYFSADSDNDGIPDNVGDEQHCKGVIKEDVTFASGHVRRDIPSCFHKSDGTLRDADGNGKLDKGECDVNDKDCDGIPNIADNDSDDDGLIDGFEDRNHLTGEVLRFGRSVEIPTYLYEVKTGESTVVEWRGEDGKLNLAICDITSGNELLGVQYARYIVQQDSSGHGYRANPERITGGIPEGKCINDLGERIAGDNCTIRSLACRAATLSSSLNFNGQYDPQNIESMIDEIDTDCDGVCDGNSISTCGNDTPNASVCPRLTRGDDPAVLSDACPTEDGDPNTNNLKLTGCPGGKRTCSKDLVFFGVQQKYRTQELWNLKDGKPAWVINEQTGKEFVFELRGTKEELAFVFYGDTDGDGLPDAVENPKGVCGVDSKTGLDFMNINSDGDETTLNGTIVPIVDGRGPATQAFPVDVCPRTPGSNHAFDERKSDADYSCGDVRRWYVDAALPTLAMFLDPDSDGIPTGFEDPELDGIYQEDAGARPEGITEAELVLINSDPLRRDSDNDGLSDLIERSVSVKTDAGRGRIFTNPSYPDTDGDGLFDGRNIVDTAGNIIHRGEDRDATPTRVDAQGNILNPDQRGTYNVVLREGQGCTAGIATDTDPTNDDTDGDTLKDGEELLAPIIDESVFFGMISSGTFSITPHGSSPVAKDSDGDGIDDNVEAPHNQIGLENSNPCLQDSDDDKRKDKNPLEEGGCALNPSETCQGGGETYRGPDADSDFLTDACELQLGTDPNDPDHDGDDLLDGDEDSNHNCRVERNLDESDPKNPDSDGDRLNDGLEKKYGTLKTNPDSDSDGILDGIEDANLNGNWDSVAETHANQADTDGDGLLDGKDTRGIGEDRNLNGIVDAGETDPRIADTDGDGVSDGDEVCHNGICSVQNINGRALKVDQGCSMTPNSNHNSMYVLFGMILAMNRVMVRRMRKSKVRE
ncbi:MAG: hypothetical protein A3I05_07285 [Deltaproteobacteria bacterium RIFCSPLOWO2_02_FULL_44_10]|nr:MAG: hypothetical protein A3C46_04265 [Deltaproteobacteria bacterium RIFCSPHIGHO2_02_FULL_44_16]OGQ46394.1 MAG: hypothetical protein A3I05_07285 [Deltaproteobacteria bacterium RIFCSPLOWO2_02_FULL_44_10]